MKCSACSRELQPLEAMRVDGKSNGKDITFFAHRPSEDGRCFRQVVFGQGDAISLVEISTFESINDTPAATPYRCPICVGPDYYGKLLFGAEPIPDCVNPHFDPDGEKMSVSLVRTEGFVERKVDRVNLSDYDGVRAMKGL